MPSFRSFRGSYGVFVSLHPEQLQTVLCRERFVGNRKECVKHSPKCHLKFFKNYTLANSIAVEKFSNLCYNNKQARQVCQNA